MASDGLHNERRGVVGDIRAEGDINMPIAVVHAPDRPFGPLFRTRHPSVTVFNSATGWGRHLTAMTARVTTLAPDPQLHPGASVAVDCDRRFKYDDRTAHVLREWMSDVSRARDAELRRHR